MRASGYLPLALTIAMLATSACSSHESSQSSGDTKQGATTSGSISRDDAISDHWDEIRET